MKTASPIVVIDESPRNAVVLRIASAARNSVTQLYPERVQISMPHIEDLNRKIIEKLRLHKVDDVNTQFSIEFSDDKTVTLDSIESFQAIDPNTQLLTNLITARWTFVFDTEGNGTDHIHSVVVRISERLHPAMIFQRMVSGRTEDIDSIEGEAFSPISCRIDFLEGRFSKELLAVITDWVKALPKAEPTFGLIRWLRRHCSRIQELIYGTFPPLIMLAGLGVWMAYLPPWMNTSVKVGVAWVILSAVAYLVARYIARTVNSSLERQLERICSVPVFLLTSGDKNRMTKYLAKSHKSLITLALNALVYGVFKAAGLYLFGMLLHRLTT